MTEYYSKGYKFKFNVQTGSSIAIYEPNKKNAFMAISGPSKCKLYYYKLECERWLLTKGIQNQKEYQLAEGKILDDEFL